MPCLQIHGKKKFSHLQPCSTQNFVSSSVLEVGLMQREADTEIQTFKGTKALRILTLPFPTLGTARL